MKQHRDLAADQRQLSSTHNLQRALAEYNAERMRLSSKPRSAFLTHLSGYDVMQKCADAVAALIPPLLTPNLRASLARPSEPLEWVGDRLLGLLIGIALFSFASPIASFLVAVSTSFVLHYHDFLEYFIRAGMDRGVWGVKLNAALVASVGNFWRQCSSFLAAHLPPPYHATWCSVSSFLSHFCIFR